MSYTIESTLPSMMDNVADDVEDMSLEDGTPTANASDGRSFTPPRGL